MKMMFLNSSTIHSSGLYVFLVFNVFYIRMSSSFYVTPSVSSALCDIVAAMNLNTRTDLTGWKCNSNFIIQNTTCWTGMTCNQNNPYTEVKAISLTVKSVGSIPSSIGNLVNLESLTSSTGSLQGSIPESMSFLSKLRVLNFRTNKLFGTIPVSLGCLTNLQSLVLNSNSLSLLLLS